MAGRKGAVYAVLVERLAKAASDVGVDVVLVAFGPVGYAAAQRARQKTPDAQRWDMGERSETLNAQAERLAGTAQRRDLVLFLGAGVSAGAGLPMWNALIEQLAAPLGMDASYRERLRALDVRDQALLVARKFQDDANYRSALADLVRSERHALAHALLAGLGAREAVTTNYDTLYEDACRSGGRKVAVLPYEPIGPEGRWVLKLHGDISRGDMVLTRADYLGLPERATALFGIVQAMLITKHMLFVGYSLADDTFHRLVDGVRRARRPAADGQGTRAAIGTAVQLFDDLLLQELWGDDLDFVFLAPQPPGGVDGPAIARAARLLDVFLDRVGFLAADVSSFLLDPTYADLLDEGEARMAEAVRTLLSAAGESDGPLQERLRDALEAFGGGTGEDRRQREQLPEEIACPQCKTRAKLQGYNYCSRTCATAAGRLRRGAMVEAPVHGQSEGEADLPEPKLPKK
ncbi:SIR2-like domain-containing protein [Hyaloraphidium curvatum]|nr:SIR2-like domain-containing protein [Hyaloraphidium curvatum]